MNILLSNDDGIHAPGIRELHNALSSFGNLQVCAPDSERSACGHAITLSAPIKTTSYEIEGTHFGTAVSGTPADCAKLAIRYLFRQNPPDLVVSGINLGSNTGISVLYSGTVSAACEATILGVPAVAFSLCTEKNPHWETAAAVAKEVVERIMNDPLPSGTFLNVNIPNIPLSEFKGIKAAKMGKSRFIEHFHAHKDPKGNDYYWLDGDLHLLDDDAETDIQVVASGHASITPIHIEMTALHAMNQIRQWNTKSE